MADIESYESALGAIPGAHPYPRTSRYHDAEIGIHRLPDGTEVRYAKRRLLPPLDAQETQEHVVGAGSGPICSPSGSTATPASGGASPTPTP